MPQFRVTRDVHGTVRGSQVHIVEAETAEDAIQIAEGLGGCEAEENIVRDDRTKGEWEVD